MSGAALGLVLLATGCTVREGVMADVSTVPVVYDSEPEFAYTRQPPPPPPQEAIPPSPGEGYAWVAGDWTWTPSGRWEWREGRWVQAEPGSVWVAGRWERKDEGRFDRVPGHWEKRAARRQSREHESRDGDHWHG